MCRPNSSDQGETLFHRSVPYQCTSISFCCLSSISSTHLRTDCHPIMVQSLFLHLNSSMSYKVDTRSEDSDNHVLCVHSTARLRWPRMQECQTCGQSDARISCRVRFLVRVPIRRNGCCTHNITSCRHATATSRAACDFHQIVQGRIDHRGHCVSTAHRGTRATVSNTVQRRCAVASVWQGCIPHHIRAQLLHYGDKGWIPMQSETSHRRDVDTLRRVRECTEFARSPVPRVASL